MSSFLLRFSIHLDYLRPPPERLPPPPPLELRLLPPPLNEPLLELRLLLPDENEPELRELLDDDERVEYELDELLLRELRLLLRDTLPEELLLREDELRTLLFAALSDEELRLLLLRV